MAAAENGPTRTDANRKKKANQHGTNRREPTQNIVKSLSAVARGGFSRGGFGIWLKIDSFRGVGGPGGL